MLGKKVTKYQIYGIVILIAFDNIISERNFPNIKHN